MNGFLGTRASLMLDVVALAMLGVLPVLGLSIWLAKRGRYVWHKRIQLTLAVVLLATVAAFEVDMRFLTNWRIGAAKSPYYSTLVMPSLWIHLVFSVSTAVLWVYVVTAALIKMPNPPGPSPYGRRHRFWARLAAIDMTLTALTGWIFYYLAFVAHP